jgi:uncharacterized membrane protein
MIRQIPDDVWASFLALAVLGTVLRLDPGFGVRLSVVLCALLVLPGYALLTVLFPRANRGEHRTHFIRRVPSTLSEYLTGGLEGGNPPSLASRLALSVGLSVALVPLLGLLTAAVVGTVSFRATAVVVGGFVALATVAGLVRRLRVSQDERYAPSFLDGVATLRASVAGESSRGTAVNVALGLSVLVAIVTTGFVFTVPNDGTSYTTTALYGTNDQGELVAGDLPTELQKGGNGELVLSVENHRTQAVDYTVVSKLQKTDGNGTVVAERRLNTFSKTVAGNETWTRRHTVSPSLTGDRVRVVYLVYTGSPPESPTRSNADVSLYHWISVTNG